jgi:hypothetical protein
MMDLRAIKFIDPQWIKIVDGVVVLTGTPSTGGLLCGQFSLLMAVSVCDNTMIKAATNRA